MCIKHLPTRVPVLLLRVFTLLLGSSGRAGGRGEHVGMRADASRELPMLTCYVEPKFSASTKNNKKG